MARKKHKAHQTIVKDENEDTDMIVTSWIEKYYNEDTNNKTLLQSIGR